MSRDNREERQYRDAVIKERNMLDAIQLISARDSDGGPQHPGIDNGASVGIEPSGSLSPDRVNWKNRLNEWLQRLKKPVLKTEAYQTSQHGPPHTPFFHCVLAVPELGPKPFLAEGTSWKRSQEAQQEAARLACACINAEGRFTAAP
jgi:hypothetical protein